MRSLSHYSPSKAGVGGGSDTMCTSRTYCSNRHRQSSTVVRLRACNSCMPSSSLATHHLGTCTACSRYSIHKLYRIVHSGTSSSRYAWPRQWYGRWEAPSCRRQLPRHRAPPHRVWKGTTCGSPTVRIRAGLARLPDRVALHDRPLLRDRMVHPCHGSDGSTPLPSGPPRLATRTLRCCVHLHWTPLSLPLGPCLLSAATHSGLTKALSLKLSSDAWPVSSAFTSESRCSR